MPRTSAPDTHEAASRLEDMATQRVPEEHTVSGWHIALILVGIVITIPAFLTGAELGLALGVKGISVAIPVGALTLCLIGCLTATVAVQSRLTTYMIIRRAFGFSGARRGAAYLMGNTRPSWTVARTGMSFITERSTLSGLAPKTVKFASFPASMLPTSRSCCSE